MDRTACRTANSPVYPSFIGNTADTVLRDTYVRGKYRDVPLPMTVIRRLDTILITSSTPTD